MQRLEAWTCVLLIAPSLADFSRTGVVFAEAKDPTPDFVRDIAPLLQQHCLRCHQPGNKKEDLSLDTFADLKENGYVIPGKPEESSLLKVLLPGKGEDRPRMPRQGKPLSESEVGLIRRWIAAGAPWPEKVILRDSSRADASWWAYQPLRKADPPSPTGIPKEWNANPIDRFIYSRLADVKLSPNPPADRRTLIRRLTYDLTGLPPTPEEVEAFVKDTDKEAYAKWVERLLASPRYGEHWGRHWLDVVRFGESNGFERNVIINNVWPFRDYVIRSFNDDKPFDQFLIEHLAGDAAGGEDPGQQVATAFLVCGPYDNVGNSDAVQRAIIRANTIDEMIRATSEAFLGLTIGCARCHDHKFDPITQKDYYSLYATFAGVQHGERPVGTAEELRARATRLKPLTDRRDTATKQRNALQAQIRKSGKEAKPTPEQQAELDRLNAELARVNKEIAAVPALPVVWAGKFTEIKGHTYHVFLGGDPQKRGLEVQPASLSALGAMKSAFQLPSSAAEKDRRLALARWMVAADNPLTPRVLANRLWHYHFGTGIVDTPSDFGWMGGRPSHPELLDWLAGELVKGGWRLKALHRLIVTSQTYQQSAAWREDAARQDGNSRLLWRFPPRRLSGEEVRDTMLAIAGKLDTSKSGGPGFRLYKYIQDNVATYVPLDEHGPETYRRSVYHQNARAARVDVLTDFDCPDPANATPRRASTTTPLQALALLNHRFTHDMACFLAERVKKEAGPEQARQIERVFLLAYARVPDKEELAAALAFVKKQDLQAFCLAVLNSNELIFLR